MIDMKLETEQQALERLRRVYGAANARRSEPVEAEVQGTVLDWAVMGEVVAQEDFGAQPHGATTVRDLMAMTALGGILTGSCFPSLSTMAVDAYALADAMLKARGR